MTPALLRRHLAALLLAAACPAAMTQTPAPSPAPAPDDPFLWLEDVTGERAMAWVRERNAVTRATLEREPGFTDLRGRLLAVLNSRDRIPGVGRLGDRLLNLWQDERNKRGLLRLTTLDEYRKPQPAWDVVLDLDALAAKEGENWVFGGLECRAGATGRCLLSLSRGGADATVVREFDLGTRRFVEGGFSLPEAKSSVDWLDDDTLLVGTDFGPGSMTDSGYPRVVKRWKRGTPLAEAVTVFEGQASDVSASASVDPTPGFERVTFQRGLDFYNTEQFLWRDGRAVKLDKPTDAGLAFWRERVLIELRSDWTVGGRTFPRGALLVAGADDYLAGRAAWQPLFTPTATRSMAGWTTTRTRVLVQVLDNVASRLEEYAPGDGGAFVRREVKAPFPGTLSVQALHDPRVPDDPLAEHYLLQYTDFLTPDSLMLGRAGQDGLEALKARAAFFDSTGMRAEQRFATSKDGTRVPYFVVWPRGARADGDNPTLLYGYGGFEVSMQPWYSGNFGTAWYARGGVLVIANIRGGGEYGPAWHQAALKGNRQSAYDDFIAVAEDLIATKVTSPRRLGIEGGSNGGLLVGAVMVQRPDLFRAVVCQVPLLDMRRFHTLLAGASWMGEYGNPDDPQEWAYISRYSPYQNVKPGVRYPSVLFTTSTRDDRVHPGHARKMAARMLQQGHPEVLYYENIEGGHGGAADNEQKADMLALEGSFLWRELGR